MRAALAGLIGLLWIIPSAVAAQEQVALAIEGWRQWDRPDGVVAYRCASSICDAGSELSYKRQPHRPALTLSDFREHYQRIAEQASGKGRLRGLRISDAAECKIDGVRILQVRRMFEWADGSSNALIESRLVGPKSSYSFVSVSPKLAWSVTNFEGLLPRLVDIAALTAHETDS